MIITVLLKNSLQLAVKELHLENSHPVFKASFMLEPENRPLTEEEKEVARQFHRVGADKKQSSGRRHLSLDGVWPSFANANFDTISTSSALAGDVKRRENGPAEQPVLQAERDDRKNNECNEYDFTGLGEEN